MLGYFGQGYFGEYGVDVITQALPAFAPAWVFEVDWDGNGAFDGPNDDLTSRLISINKIRKGRGEPNSLTSLADPSDLEAVFDNRDGLMSTFNASSSIYGDANPKKEVRFRISQPIAVNRFTGFLEDVTDDYLGAVPVAVLTAKGALGQIIETDVTPPASAGDFTGNLIDLVLDLANWPAGKRAIDTGQSQTSRWYEPKKKAIDIVRPLEQTELGFLLDDEDGNIVFQDRSYRQTGARLVSQAEYSDAPGATFPYLRGMKQLNPAQYIKNEALITVPSLTVSGLGVLWTLQETPVLSPGQSIERWANYPNPNSATGAAYVDAWTTPVVGTDITQSGVADADIGVSVDKFATAMKITITNNNVGSSATLTLVQARGTGVISGDRTTVSSEALASQAIYGIQTYRNEAPWVESLNAAQDLVDAITQQNGDPHPAFMVPFLANMNPALFSELMTRRISDRVTFVGQETLTALGVAADCFIESMEERLDVQNNRYEIMLGLSNAGAGTEGQFWILGTSVLDTDTVWGF